MAKVAVIIVSYNHARFLPALFESLGRVSYPRASLKIFFLDNASVDGSAAIARERLKNSGLVFEIIESRENFGFAGGNNQCIRVAMEEGFEFVFLLNPDTEVEPDFLERAVSAMSNASVAAAQSLLLLAQERGVINSVGNAFHYLGFSYCLGYCDRLDDPKYAGLTNSTPEITVASGAAVLLRVTALQQVGLLDEKLFAYHEDLDLSLRLRLAGWKVILASRSVVYHRYEFSRSIKKYYLMERNRWIVLWKTLKLRTLLLLTPMQIIMETGLFLFAIKSGWWREELQAHLWFLSPRNLQKIFRSRQETQRLRKISDRELVKDFTTDISYQEVSNFLLKKIGNPLMKIYWQAVKPLIRW